MFIGILEGGYASTTFYILLITAVFFILAIFILIAGISTRRRIIKAYNEIYTTYPELQNNINNLYEQADFRDDKLNIIIYKHHLVTHYREFCVADLNNTYMIYHYITTTSVRGITFHYYNLRVSVKNRGTQLAMPIRSLKILTDSKLLTTFEYIHKHFPDVIIRPTLRNPYIPK
ncbi:MAG: hypothetical protein Q4A90_04790 [Streptococcus sp.]|nr:hypothetical protein [Streptococcus sp.]